MSNVDISQGVVHELPDDMKDMILENEDIFEIWEDITPLARNEWICWITTAKRQETRVKRIDWMCSNLRAGKRRPCCWPGCPHR